MKEKLQILEKQIRKDLPRLSEPTEGCKLTLLYQDDRKEDAIIVGNNNRGLYRLLFSDRVDFYNEKTIDENIFIGHDIMLNDVLDMFIVKPRDHTNHFKNTTRILEIVNHWDLSKPYLKDQSEELIEFLYDLIEE